MGVPAIGADGYYHPANESEVRELVSWAAEQRLQVRVRGSAHSVAAAIYASDPGGPRRGVNVLLDRLKGLSFNEAQKRVIVQAGCHLGRDPGDPSGTSTEENSLFSQLDRREWAVPDMGGIIHQSVGGFLSTGSAGGSLKHSIYDAIIAIRLIDGHGQPQTYQRPQSDAADPGNEFFGSVISLGLLGVITEVTIQCVPKYHVIGHESATSLADAGIDLFAGGAKGLERYLRDTEHARLLWWPQTGVGKVVMWEARTMKAGDYTDETGSPSSFKPKPYQLLQPFLGSGNLAQVMANKIFRTFGRLNPPPPRSAAGRMVDRMLGALYGPVINFMLRPTKPGAPRRFWDIWWRGLPMDNEASDELLPTEFTEAWIPLERTAAVLNALREHYAAGGFDATGTYACEIYAAKSSPFWLSPAFGADVLRIDLFWFAKNEGNPERDYYPRFWDLLDRFTPRYHWGKYFPTTPAKLTARYPRWGDFLKLRQRHDPAGVFLTPYWREKLGLKVV